MNKQYVDIDIQHDLSGYDEEDAKKLSEIGQYIDQFFKDYQVIYRENKLVANRLLSDFDSRNRAVSAEARIIAEKAMKDTIEIKAISVTSSDAFYMQMKTGGISVRQEIKSVTRDKASDIDGEIVNAESQHKARLKDEQGDPTWHKSTIVIGTDKNPWPFSTKEDLEKYQEEDEEKVLRQAEYRMKRLALGAVAPKSKKTPIAKIYIKELLAAEKQHRKVGHVKIDAPKKGGMKKPGKLKKELKQLEKEADDQKKANKKNKKVEERLQRQILVTERVTVVNPYQNFRITLDRQMGGQFVAHFKKYKARDTAEAKLPRRHWNKPGKFRSRSRSYPDGNSALHEAAKEGDLRLVRSYIDQGIDKKNKFGQTSLHLAAMHGHVDVVEFFLDQDPNLINIKDTHGNTPLHLACSEGRVDVVKCLVSRGADINEENGKHQLPVDLVSADLYNEIEEIFEGRKVLK